MRDVEYDRERDRPYECFDCGTIVTRATTPLSCPDCGGSMRNRMTSLE